MGILLIIVFIGIIVPTFLTSIVLLSYCVWSLFIDLIRGDAI